MLGDWGEFVTGLFTYPAYYLTVSDPSLLSSYTNFSLKISGVFLNAHEGPLLYLMHQTECYYILTCTYRYLWVLLRLICLVKVPLNISIEEYHNCDHFIIQVSNNGHGTSFTLILTQNLKVSPLWKLLVRKSYLWRDSIINILWKRALNLIMTRETLAKGQCLRY